MNTNSVLEKILKKYKLEENQSIKIDLINKIYNNEKISKKDLQNMLQISNSTMSKLKNGHQLSTKLNFNKYDGIKNKKLIKKRNINYSEFNILKDKLNIKNYTLIHLLGISVYSYNKMKNDINYKAKIKDIRIKHIVDLIIIDLKYQSHKNPYCSITRLKNICKKMKITIYQFAEYYNSNPKHYKFNLMIIEKSSKGFWISLNQKMPDEFINNYYDEIIHRLNSVVNWLSFRIPCKYYKEDLIQETFNKLYLTCGNIVQNFYFDINVIFNILIAKAKYIMFNIYLKKYRNLNVISYYGLIGENSIDHLSILKDNTFNPQILIE